MGAGGVGHERGIARYFAAVRLPLCALLVAAWTASPARASARWALLVTVVAEGESGEQRAARASAARRQLGTLGMENLPSEALAELVAERDWPAPLDPITPDHAESLLAPFEAAMEVFFAGELEAAVTRYRAAFDQAMERRHRLAAIDESGARVVDHGLRFVRLLRGLGDKAEADQVLSRLARIGDPRATPSVTEHPPELIDEFGDERRRRIARGRRVEIALAPLVDKAGADGGASSCRVFVNGWAVSSPLRLPPGEHVLHAECGPLLSSLYRLRVAPGDGHGAPIRLVLSPEMDNALELCPSKGLELHGSVSSDLAALAEVVGSALGVERVAFSYLEMGGARLFLSKGRGDESEGRLMVTERAGRPRLWSYVTLGAGLSLMGGGGYFHWAARDATRRINSGEQVMGRREQSLTGMWICYGIGSAMLVSSALLFIFEPALGSSSDSRWVERPLSAGPDLRLVPGPLGVALDGRF